MFEISGTTRLLRVLFAVAIPVSCLLLTQVQAGSAEQGNSSDSPRELTLRGRVVCILEEIQKQFGAGVAAEHDHLWGFQSKSQNGKIYTLAETRLSEALFLDERLREKELIIKGRVFPKTQVLEATKIQSVQDGKVYDLYYYCDICSITTVTPRECSCCRGPVRLVEELLED